MRRMKVTQRGDKGSDTGPNDHTAQDESEINRKSSIDNRLLEQVLLKSQEAVKALGQVKQKQEMVHSKSERKTRNPGQYKLPDAANQTLGESKSYFLPSIGSHQKQVRSHRQMVKESSPSVPDAKKTGQEQSQERDSIVPVNTRVMDLEAIQQSPHSKILEQKSGQYLMKIAEGMSHQKTRLNKEHNLIVTEPTSPHQRLELEDDIYQPKTTNRKIENGRRSRKLSHDFVSALGEKEAENERLRALNEALKTQVDRLLKENEALRSQASQRESVFDVAVIHAEPKYYNGEKLDNMSTSEDSKVIKAAIKNASQHVKYKKVLGTFQNLRDTVFNQPKILHLCLKSVSNNQSQDQKQNALLLEGPEGGAQIIRWDFVIKGLESELSSIMIAIISNEASDQIAQMFASKIRHVVFLKSRQKIAKKTKATFLDQLYTLLLSGQTVCKAFDRAREFTVRQTGDQMARRFEMLRNDKHMKNECVNYFWPRRKGQLENLTSHVRFKVYQSKSTVREVSLQRSDDVLTTIYQTLVQQDSRLMCIRGLKGSGKSLFLDELLKYANQRKAFLDGTMSLSLAGVASKQCLLAYLKNTIISLLKIGSQTEHLLKRSCFSERATIEFITHFLNKTFDDRFDEINASKDSQVKRALLVFDDCSEMMEYCRLGLKQIIVALQHACPKLKVLVIHRQPLYFNAIEMQFPKLAGTDDVSLFTTCLAQADKQVLKNSILQEETISLIEGTRKEHFFRDIAPVIKQGGVRAFLQGNNTQAMHELLHEHPLFSQLMGNMTAIQNLATCFRMQKLKQSVSYNEDANSSLLQLYNLMKEVLTELYNHRRVPKSQRERYLDQSSNADDSEHQLGDFAITVTTMMIFELFDRTSIRNMLHFLSFFPGGIRRDHLLRIWSQTDSRPDLAELEKFALVELHQSSNPGTSILELDQESSNEIKSSMRIYSSFKMSEFTFRETTQESKFRFLRFIVDFMVDRLKQNHKELLINPHKSQRKISKIDEQLRKLQRGKAITDGNEKSEQKTQASFFFDIEEQKNFEFILDRVLEQLWEGEKDFRKSNSDNSDEGSGSSDYSYDEEEEKVAKPSEIDLKGATQLSKRPSYKPQMRSVISKSKLDTRKDTFSMEHEGLMHAYTQGTFFDDQQKTSVYEETFSFYKNDESHKISQYQAFILFYLVNLIQIDELILARQVSKRALLICKNCSEKLSYFERNLMRLNTEVTTKLHQVHVQFDSPASSAKTGKDLKRRVNKLVSYSRRMQTALGYVPHRELGLQLFQIGMLYKTYPQLLASSVKAALQYAEECLRRSYSQFQAVEHLRGMYFAKKQEASLLSDAEYDRLSRQRDQGTQTAHQGLTDSEPPITPSLRSRKQLAQEALQQAKHAKTKLLAAGKNTHIGSEETLLLEIVEAEREDMRQPQLGIKQRGNRNQKGLASSKDNDDSAFQIAQLNEMQHQLGPLMSPMMVQPVDGSERQVKFVNKLYSEVDEHGKLQLRFDNRWQKASSALSSAAKSTLGQGSPTFSPAQQTLASPSIRFQPIQTTKRKTDTKKKQFGALSSTQGKQTFQASPNATSLIAPISEERPDMSTFGAEAHSVASESKAESVKSQQSLQSKQSSQIAAAEDKPNVKDALLAHRQSLQNKKLKHRPSIMNVDQDEVQLRQPSEQQTEAKDENSDRLELDKKLIKRLEN